MENWQNYKTTSYKRQTIRFMFKLSARLWIKELVCGKMLNISNKAYEISSNISLICSQIFHKCVSYTTPKRTKINKYWKPCFRKLHTHPGTLTSWTINLSASAKTERFPLNDISSLTCAITRVSVNKDNIHASWRYYKKIIWNGQIKCIW